MNGETLLIVAEALLVLMSGFLLGQSIFALIEDLLQDFPWDQE
jgi:hypothetical protein